MDIKSYEKMGLPVSALDHVRQFVINLYEILFDECFNCSSKSGCPTHRTFNAENTCLKSGGID